MLRSALDRAFVRYARTGEPGALARVFDGSAAELYRLGFHLLGDRHAAEDLVQHTFVVAIEQAKSFDGSRRVLPWLCGILTNRALHVRRQCRQRAAASEGRDVAERVVDPAAEAGAREAEVVVGAAVRSLDEPYRQVLLLHLVHELAPKDIAEALARPDATVRTQLARGLELLRRALPLGIAGLAAGQVPPPRLGAVRAAVIARAAEVAGSAAVGAAGVVVFTGVVAMKKVLLVLAAVIAAVFAWPWLVPPGPVPVAAVDARTRGPTPVVAPSPTASPTDAGAANERVEAPAAIDASTAALEVRVSWSDGAPAADVPVRVRARPLDVERWLRVVRTDDHGVASFTGLPPGEANALTGRGASADVELAAGAHQRATITLEQGLDVRGRVVDLDERPVAGATVWMSVNRCSDDSEPVATTGSDGTFEIRAAGREFVVTATAPGLGCAREAWVDRSELVLRLRPAPGVLAGTVVDPQGRPVGGARVLVGVTGTQPGGVHQRFLGRVIGQDLWPSCFARTDAEGHFRCEGLPAIPWPVQVGAPGFAPAWQEVQLRADGETNVTIVLTAGAAVRGRVLDDRGQPITGASVCVFSPQRPTAHVLIGPGVPAGVSPLWARRVATTDANGRYELLHVSTGNVELATWHDGADARAGCELGDGQAFEWNPVIVPVTGQPLHGTLVDENGAPLARWALRVDTPGATRASSVWVREDGSFRTNRVGPGKHRLVAHPREPMIGDDVDVGSFDVASCPLRVVVPREHVPTARLRGRIVLPKSAPSNQPVRVWVRDASKEPVQAVCDADGSYEVGPLQAGEYRLRVESAAFGDLTIGTVEVADGRDTDAGAFRVPAPGKLVVHAVDARGRHAPDTWIVARAIADDLRATGLDHLEAMSCGYLQPGRWLVTTRDRTVLASVEVEVRADETTDVQLGVPDGARFSVRMPVLPLERCPLRIRWFAAGGALLRQQSWYGQDVPSDEEVFAAPGRYTLEVTDAQGKKTSATFDLHASDPPQVVELPL